MNVPFIEEFGEIVGLQDIVCGEVYKIEILVCAQGCQLALWGEV